MEPVTHLLTGACLARTGFNRRAAYATIGMAIAAEFPDIDTLWGLRGSVAGFQHHRGVTHTLLGIPVEAGLLTLGFVLYHRVRRHPPEAHTFLTQSNFRRPPLTRPDPASEAPVRWGRLYAFLVLALLSHILLDFTNNYGVRPFFPFDPRWYAASIVFIFDPVIILLLLAGLLLPVLFGLIGQEVGAPRERFRGRGWARAALVMIVLLWAARWMQHDKALILAQAQTLRAPVEANTGLATGGLVGSPAPATAEQGLAPTEDRPLLMAQRSLASPDPLSIFRWYTSTDFGPAYQLGLAETRRATLVPGAVFIKPRPGDLLRKAETSDLGKVYLDWSPMPILSVRPGASPEQSGINATQATTTVIFSDPRFMGDLPILHNGTRPALSGQVILDATGHVLAEGLDGRLDEKQRP